MDSPFLSKLVWYEFLLHVIFWKQVGTVCFYFTWCLSFSFFFFFWHLEVPGLGFEPAPQLWPQPQQWQHRIINLPSHQGTPSWCLFLNTKSYKHSTSGGDLAKHVSHPLSFYKQESWSDHRLSDSPIATNQIYQVKINQHVCPVNWFSVSWPDPGSLSCKHHLMYKQNFHQWNYCLKG